MQASGKYLAIVRSTALAVFFFAGMLLLAAPGDLDTTFGTGGIVITNFQNSTSETIQAMTIDSDGNIVVVGVGATIGVAHYHPDGSLDTSFGDGDGMVDAGNGNAKGIAIDSQGRILIGGDFSVDSGSYDFFVMRLNTDGTPDSSFGDNGFAVTSLTYFDQGMTLLVDSEDRVLLGGITENDLALLRFLPDGTLDPDFGDSGAVRLDINGEWEAAYELELMADGAILAGGGQTGGALLARFNGDGTLDTMWGSGGGIVITEIPDMTGAFIADLTIDAQNRIVATGETHQGALVLRYLPNGTLDTSFNSSGYRSVSIGTLSMGFTGLSIDSEGRLVAAGIMSLNGYHHAVVMRFNPDGAVDTSFGGGDGIVYNLLPENYEHIYSIMIDSSGRILIGGGKGEGPGDGNYQFLIAGLEGGGPIVAPEVVNLVYNGSFDDIPFSSWKVTKPLGGKVLCNKPGKPPIAYDGACTFRFKGTAATRNKLVQSSIVSSRIFFRNDNLELSIQAMAPKATVKAKTKFKIVFQDGSMDKTDGSLLLTPTYHPLHVTLNIGMGSPKKIKIIISTGSDKTVYFDGVTLIANPGTGGALFNRASSPLPLPANP